ncbi:MAG: DUF2066 domain-containing protein [Pseudomonadales bacterium]|jgi:hypothetical protein|nr:DUF2066 domain-containing protein [Pseudomonadales bacterium]|tara:strand:- start:7745 stop:8878 length:1134 start_codon:yes stop_codon:yes gene_type:complete
MSKKFICNPWIVIWWNGSFMSKKVICSPWILLALAGWICPEPVAAVQVDDLYVAEVMVTSQDDRELALAARQGLRTVLTRISGVTDVDQEEAVRLALQNPQEYYFQWGYDTTDKTFQAGQEIVPAQIVRIHFEPSSVAKLLRTAGYPVWGNNRPSVLIWLVVQTDSGRMILNEADSSDVAQTLVAEAKRRGLPLMFPLLDLEDKSNISVTVVWGQFHNQIEAASSRYRADSILSGRIYQGQDGEWLGRWSWQIDDQWISFDSLQIHLSDLLGEAIDRLADKLAARYGIASSRGSVWLRVEAVEDLDDYVQLSRYLGDLTSVLDVFVEEVSGSEILYRLSTEGRVQQLVELIELDQKLFLLASGDGRDSKILHFRWLQ